MAGVAEVVVAVVDDVERRRGERRPQPPLDFLCTRAHAALPVVVADPYIGELPARITPA
jgi:hypothetical protein